MTQPSGYYFALSRLLCGTSHTGQDERSAREAYIAGAIVFVVTYAFLTAPLFAAITVARTLIATLAMPFAVWLLWAILIYLNSLVRRAAVAIGFASAPAPRIFQHALACIWLTLFSLSLVNEETNLRWIGFGWFGLLSLELSAAALLKIRNGRVAATT